MGLMSTAWHEAVDKSGDSEPGLWKAEPWSQLAVRRCERSEASAWTCCQPPSTWQHRHSYRDQGQNQPAPLHPSQSSSKQTLSWAESEAWIVPGQVQAFYTTQAHPSSSSVTKLMVLRDISFLFTSSTIQRKEVALCLAFLLPRWQHWGVTCWEPAALPLLQIWPPHPFEPCCGALLPLNPF